MATRYFGSGGGGANAPVPLERAGVRIGLHAKSMVVDERIGVVGTHNFDPRGDHYNTESMVVIDDPAFARALAASIRRRHAAGQFLGDRAAATSRRCSPGIDYSLGKVSEQLPIFDLWPLRYATSYDFVHGPGCPAPLPPDDPNFRHCYTRRRRFPRGQPGPEGLRPASSRPSAPVLAPIL